MLALPFIAAAIVGVSACSSQNPGSPVANDSSTSSTPTSSGQAGDASPLASVDPCSLITQAEVTNSQLQPGTTIPAPGGRACRWERPDDGATIDGYVLQIVIYDKAGIDQLRTAGGTVTDTSVGKYQGKLFQDTPLSFCIVSLGTSTDSRIDVEVNSRVGMQQSCTVVNQVAPAVVSHFPAGS
jgi:hypothetical protein